MEIIFFETISGLRKDRKDSAVIHGSGLNDSNLEAGFIDSDGKVISGCQFGDEFIKQEIEVSQPKDGDYNENQFNIKVDVFASCTKSAVRVFVKKKDYKIPECDADSVADEDKTDGKIFIFADLIPIAN